MGKFKEEMGGRGLWAFMASLKEGKTEGRRDSAGGRSLMWGRGGLEEGDSADEWGRVGSGKREGRGGELGRWKETGRAKQAGRLVRLPEPGRREGELGWAGNGEG
jgi:hypothetical protein